MRRNSAVVRWFRDRPALSDLARAVAIALVWAAVLVTVASPAWADRPPPGVGLLWTAVGVVPVALRRLRPWWAVTVTVALAVGSLWDLAVWQTAGLAALIVSYTVASRMALRPALVAAALLLAASVLASTAAGLRNGTLVASVLIGVLFSLVSFFMGRFTFTRHAYTAALEARALDAEANQRTLAHQAVTEERHRIARELHDVVAHQVSAMGVLATGARRMLERDPAAAGEALGSIEQTGRTTLRELRRLLNVLRTDDEGPAGEAGLTPAPGLTAVGGLIDQVRASGLPVAVSIEGEPYPVDAGIGLTVYRLIQEALANAAQHAGPARVQVRLGFGSAALSVEVFDTGRGPAGDAPTGHGLLGMRERVALYGGRLHTGPRPGGGFRVYASIPMDNLGGLSSASAGAGDQRRRAAGQ